MRLLSWSKAMKNSKSPKSVQPLGEDATAKDPLDFEENSYPNAPQETKRMLAHSRQTIQLFLSSNLGKMTTN